MDAMTRFRLAVVAAAVWPLSACGSSKPTTPSVLDLSGTITNTAGGLVAGGRIDVTAGANLGAGTNADSTGYYRLAGLSPGSLTLQISAVGHATATRDVTLDVSQVVDVQLTLTAPYTTGRVFDLISQAGFGGVRVAGSTLTATTSDTTGTFAVLATTSLSAPLDVTFSAPSVVTRRTLIRVPGPAASVSLLPASFDLASFDQMFRVPRLLRWRNPPPLLIETRAAQFVDVNAAAVTTLTDTMTDAEADSLLADLSWALPQMTGGAFQSFAGVTRRQSDPGVSIPELGGGNILVIRVIGLTALAGYWGYSRWQYLPDGTIVGGIVTLDRDFERSGSPFLRSLRTHEFGHALGYNHVTSRVSVMNSSGRIEPTQWDLDACRIAFARTPGNVPPDTDPTGYSTNIFAGAVWGPPIR